MIEICGFNSQQDARWAGLPLSKDKRLTWGNWGCLAHCLLWFCKQQGLIENPEPTAWIRTLFENLVIDERTGMMPMGGIWATRFMPFNLRVEAVTTNSPQWRQRVKVSLADNLPVFAMVDQNPNKAGVQSHWVLIVGAPPGTTAEWLIADPWTGKIGRLGDSYRDVLEFVFIDVLRHERSLAIDMSEYQEISRYNFHGIHYAYIRASDGVYRDERYIKHAEALAAANIPFSAYHFLRPASDTPIDEQCKVFLSQMVSGRQPTHMAIVDYETIDPQPTPDDLAAFIARYEADTGEMIAIYSRADVLKTVPERLLNRPILQAHYNDERMALPYGLTPAVWQFSSTGRMHWYDGNVDWNYMMDGGLSRLQRRAIIR